MNKKLKNLKRRWRKLKRSQRQCYRFWTGLLVFNYLIGFVNSTGLINAIWMAGFMWLYTQGIILSRRTAYRYYHKGRWRQIDLDNKHVAEASAIKSEYYRLRSNYNKLKYECNQLKKSFCDIQNKKTINPKTKKKK